jgi:hypothetical protein
MPTAYYRPIEFLIISLSKKSMNAYGYIVILQCHI